VNLIEGIPQPSALPEGTAAATGLRQAALLLHTLPATDRAWMLSQLPDGQRVQMDRLLAEVAELGVPADPSLLDDVVRDAAGALPASRGALSPTTPVVRRLSRLSPTLVAELLQGEPDRLIAQLLRLADWDWADEALQRLGPSRKRRVLEAVAALTTVGEGVAREPGLSARDAALLEAFEAQARSRLATSPGSRGDADADSAAPWWRRALDAVLAGKGAR
jgi:hypothetical protein